MDTSNPIVSSDRRSISEVFEGAKARRRQNIAYISSIAQTARRIELPVESPKLSRGEVERVNQLYTNSLPKVSTQPFGKPLDFLEVMAASIPVSGLLDSDGNPVHPPQVANSKGRVHASRVFGSKPQKPFSFNPLIEILGDDVLDVDMVYTSGTWDGFVTRMEKQMTRKTKSIQTTYMQVFGHKCSRKFLFETLKALMPWSRTVEWPKLGDDYMAQINMLKITATSGAGPPYHRKQSEALTHILDVCLPLLVETILQDKVLDLYKKEPEMFLVEVRNKMDRYKRGDLEVKTRPYAVVPAHWRYLFSILSQRFQSGLKLFTSAGCNAYGFSSAAGGLGKMYEWMLGTTGVRFACYGDDTCIIVNDGKALWRVDPDFQQMDGSIDREDVGLVVEWVLHVLAEDDGEDLPAFWQRVANWWVKFAVDPEFVVQGMTVYRKKKPTGLMTGVPGTTLFDTVKSVLSWHLYDEFCKLNKKNPLDFQVAKNFMLDYCGLIIKDGTWDPQRVPTQLYHGCLITEHKFLGIQILYQEGPRGPMFLPTIPIYDAMCATVVQKDSVFEKPPSNLSRARLVYDRMRGLFITFGFTIPIIRDAIHNVVNSLPPEAILIQTQLPNGAKPEHILLSEYEFPDSSGFPTIEFCESLYAGWETTGWQQIFPEIALKLWPQKCTTLSLRGDGVVEKTNDEGVAATGTGLSFARGAKPVPKPRVTLPQRPQPMPRFNKRSQIVMPDGTLKTKIPTSTEIVVEYLRRNGVATVRDLEQKFGVNSVSLQRMAPQGVHMSGNSFDDLVSLRKILTPQKTIQDELNKDPFNSPTINTLPGVLQVYFENFEDRIRKKYQVGELLVGVQIIFSKNGITLKWKTLGVVSNPNPMVKVALYGKDRTGEFMIGYASSSSSSLAKQYLARHILEHFGCIKIKATPYTLPTPETDWEQEEQIPQPGLEEEIRELQFCGFTRQEAEELANLMKTSDGDLPIPSRKGRNRRVLEHRKRKRIIAQQNKLGIENGGKSKESDSSLTEKTSEGGSEWHPQEYQPSNQQQQQQRRDQTQEKASGSGK